MWESIVRRRFSQSQGAADQPDDDGDGDAPALRVAQSVRRVPSAGGTGEHCDHTSLHHEQTRTPMLPPLRDVGLHFNAQTFVESTTHIPTPSFVSDIDSAATTFATMADTSTAPLWEDRTAEILRPVHEHLIKLKCANPQSISPTKELLLPIGEHIVWYVSALDESKRAAMEMKLW